MRKKSISFNVAFFFFRLEIIFWIVNFFLYYLENKNISLIEKDSCTVIMKY